MVDSENNGKFLKADMIQSNLHDEQNFVSLSDLPTANQSSSSDVISEAATNPKCSRKRNDKAADKKAKKEQKINPKKV